MLLVTVLALASLANVNSFNLFPGATADSEGAYFVAPEGGIQSVRLSDGRRNWLSKAAAWPLGIQDGRLVAASPVPRQSNALILVSIDLKDGRQSATSKPNPLPAWANVLLTYNEAAGQRFAIVQTGERTYTWVASTYYAGGAPPPAKVLAEANRSEARRLLFDVTTGAVGSPRTVVDPNGVQAGLGNGNPDQTSPNSFMLSSPVEVGDLKIYLSETVSPKSYHEPHPLRAVAVDRESGKLRWAVPLGTRYVPPPRP